MYGYVYEEYFLRFSSGFSRSIVNGRFFGGKLFHSDDLQSVGLINLIFWLRCLWRYNVDLTDANDGKCSRISVECSVIDRANSSSYILGIVIVSSAARFFKRDRNSCWGSTRNVRPCKWPSLRRTTRSPYVRTLALHNSLRKINKEWREISIEF